MELNKIYNENCLETMKRMPDNFINCVVTSPPYWGLRDYGGWKMTILWDGSWEDFQLPRKGNKRKYYQLRLKLRAAQKGIVWARNKITHICSHGLEPTPELYIQHTVQIFREVRRVLKPEGKLWLNLGDTYNNNSSYSNTGRQGYNGKDSTINKMQKSLKPKDLIGIPWRVAFALQADGWWLRQDIIWAKPNPMPESVKDRCTKAHEYIFLLTKSAKYYYDADAISEPIEWLSRALSKNNSHLRKKDDGEVWKGLTSKTQDKYYEKVRNGEIDKRNRRDVWEIATQSFPEAHFAVFPEKIPSLCILAGCPEDGIVYDPFIGAGTTALAALKYGQKFIGSEINSEYCAIAEKRIKPYLQQLNLAI